MSQRTARRRSRRRPRDDQPAPAVDQPPPAVQQAAVTPASHRRLHADCASGMASRLADAWAPMLGLTVAVPEETAVDPGEARASAEREDAPAP